MLLASGNQPHPRTHEGFYPLLTRITYAHVLLQILLFFCYFFLGAEDLLLTVTKKKNGFFFLLPVLRLSLFLVHPSLVLRHSYS